jgi:hypothetical protein
MSPTHRTGEYVPRNRGGRWSDQHGHTVRVQGGDVFPPCPQHRHHTVWTYVGP